LQEKDSIWGKIDQPHGDIFNFAIRQFSIYGGFVVFMLNAGYQIENRQIDQFLNQSKIDELQN
tara:strand:- start:155 stop:343 length:189 start_codon:yes stop_codon:yes gene_type:complete